MNLRKLRHKKIFFGDFPLTDEIPKVRQPVKFEPLYDDDEMEKRYLRFLNESGLDENFFKLCSDGSESSSSDQSSDEGEYNEQEVEELRKLIDDSPDEEIACSICQQTFANQNILDFHLKSHKASIKSFECPVCFKKFTKSVSLKKHSKTHREAPEAGPPKQFQCQDCSRSYNSVSHLKAHYTLIHPSSEFGSKLRIRDKLKCLFCERKFAGKYKLEHHLVVHDSSRKFECLECHYRYDEASKLKRHYTTSHPMSKSRKIFNAEQFKARERRIKQIIHDRNSNPVKSEDAAEKRSKVFNKKRPNSSKGQGLKHPIFPSYHEVVVDFNKNFLCPICWMQFEDKAEQFRHLGSHFKSARSVKDYKACFNPTVEVTRNEFETAEAARTVKISIIL